MYEIKLREMNEIFGVINLKFKVYLCIEKGVIIPSVLCCYTLTICKECLKSLLNFKISSEYSENFSLKSLQTNVDLFDFGFHCTLFMNSCTSHCALFRKKKCLWVFCFIQFCI